MGREKKFKCKKKGIFLVLFLLLLLGAGIGGYLFYCQGEKNHYQYVTSTQDISLYDMNEKVVGKVYKDSVLELAKLSNKKHYYLVKNTKYYVFSKDVEEAEGIKAASLPENQVPLDKKIKITKETTLYSNQKEYITFKEPIKLSVIYENKDSYYVDFQKNLLEVKKDPSIEESKRMTSEKAADHVSVLFYEDIMDNCGDSTCTTTALFKSQMTELLNGEYYTLTKEEFKNYLKGYIRIKPNAVFITTSSSLDSLKPITDELKIAISNVLEDEELLYFSTNQTNTAKITPTFINRYQIRSNTAPEEIIKLANGEKREIIQDNQAIAVLNYHFFYAGNEVCGESICLDTVKFREHLDYLRDHHYKTLTMNEFKKWMYGEIELPEKSVLITVDDGAMGTGTHNGNKLIPLLEEYKMHATLFLIAGWWSIDNYRSPYLDIQSHTFDMHQYGSCGRGQINCASYEEAKADLEKSLAIIQNKDSFCFPFYMYSNTSLQAVKDAGFQLAFVGGMKKATRSNDKFLVPRYPIHSDITLNQFINMVS